jgi:hypothetical protein
MSNLQFIDTSNKVLTSLSVYYILHIDDVEVKFIVEQKIVSVTTSNVILTIYDPVDKIILAKRVHHLKLLNFLETT